MKIIKWEQLPLEMQTSEVKKYYDILRKRKLSLFFKRVFDVIVSLIMFIVLSPVFFVLAIAIKLDSKGPVFYRQERVTQYGKLFRIHKFRTMIHNADKGLKVTVNNDSRITRVGKFIRNYRLDEIAQLIDVIAGDMSFVGTRPEATKYVKYYNNEMYATLLLPAGITSETSIKYRDEALLLDEAENPEKTYIEKILPEKMKYNLDSIKRFSFRGEIKTMFRTVLAVLGKKYN